jgi:hypothetical protein
VVYWVKGTRQEAKMRFKSHRKTRMGIVSFGFLSKREDEVLTRYAV